MFFFYPYQLGITYYKQQYAIKQNNISNRSIEFITLESNFIPKTNDYKSNSEFNELITDKLIAVYGNRQAKQQSNFDGFPNKKRRKYTKHPNC